MPIDLMTTQGENLTGTPWQVYPRPQMRRNSYVNLNGKWEFTVSDTKPESYDREILVPFCPESLLSGVQKHFPEGTPLNYRRKFTLPANFNRGRVLLHIGAADQIAEIYVNQVHLTTHIGGYDSFTVDITSALQAIERVIGKQLDKLNSSIEKIQ